MLPTTLEIAQGAHICCVYELRYLELSFIEIAARVFSTWAMHIECLRSCAIACWSPLEYP